MNILNKLKSFKYSSSIYNLFHLNQLQHIKRAYARYGIIKRPWEPVEAREFLQVPGQIPRLDDINSRDVLPYKDEFQGLNAPWKESLLDWSDNGYAILEDLFSVDEVNTINREIEHLLDTGQIHWKYERKLMFAYRKSQEINAILHESPLIDILEMLLEKPLVLFSSINFKKGSQQQAHSDSIHMTTFPYGNMIAVWIALEDIEEDAGPVFYYPGSHKLPYVMNHTFQEEHSNYFLQRNPNGNYERYIASQLRQMDMQKQVFTPRKGSVLIWHANLLHGGTPQVNMNASRKSMVLHFFAPEAICYHEITCRPALIPEKDVQASLNRNKKNS